MSVPKPDREAGAVRHFGRMQLLRLLGRSERTMAWMVADGGIERLLVLPRVQPQDAAQVDRWIDGVRRAARLQHPNLAPVIDVGARDGWPFVLHDLQGHSTLADKLPRNGLPGAEAAALALHVLRGLAYAHEAGSAHLDLQPWLVLVDDQGHARCAGLGAGLRGDSAEAAGDAGTFNSSGLRQQRGDAQRDVLAAGVLLHRLLAGTPPLDEPDVGRVIARLPPEGREVVRLPWTGAHPIADPLRAIVNRATDRQERQRYRNARTLIGALEGWLQTESASGGGALALLADRLRAAGALPSTPGAAARAARIALMEKERTSDLADVVLDDLALSFELLRTVNSAQVRGAQIAGNGPVLTVRRAIAMVGLEGVRRVALGLRPWPGPLDEAGAERLARLLERCKRAAGVALALRPPGYDGEVVYLVTMLQALGRLVVHYHFSDEAEQIRRLMLPAPPARAGEPEEPGMPEEAAAFAVLGADIEAMGSAVARWWGLDDSVLTMTRRLPLAGPVRQPEGDDEMLRTVASCAHETVDATTQPPARVQAALQRVAQRYGRVLNLTLRELQAALQGGGGAAAASVSQPTPPMPVAPPDEPAAPASPSTLRRTAATRSPT
jgi:eukaryotic-like serine/threonine-protein kinase